jgi:hypothetical protein
MAESLGSVYADVQLRLDKLDQAIMQVSAKMDKLGNIIVKKSKKSSDESNNAFSKFGKKFEDSLSNLSKTSVGQFTKMVQGIQGALNAAPIIAMITVIVSMVQKLVSGIGNWLNETTAAYRAQQVEIAKLGAVLNSTGAAAWTSATQLSAMAKSLEQSMGAPREEIMKMQAVLLGFRSISGDVFERTTKAIIDMAAVMGGDLAGAANVVGKAIDTPVEGMTALSKQGFIFTQKEKELVASLEAVGKHAEAQNIILEALETTFAGAAAAIDEAKGAADRLEDAEKRLKIAQGESNSGIVEWWKNQEAGWKEMLAEVAELENAVDSAYKDMANNYEEYEAKVEGARARLKKLIDEEADQIDIDTQKSMVITYELEVENKKAVNALAIAQYAVYQYELKLRSVGKTADRTHDKEYDQLLKIVEQYQAAVDEVENKVKAHGDEYAALDRLRRQSMAVQEQVADAAARANAAELEAGKNVIFVGALHKALGKTTSETRAAIASGYEREIDALLQERRAITAVHGVSKEDSEMKEAALKKIDKQLEIATANYKKYHDAASGRGSGAGKESVDAQIAKLRETFRKVQETAKSQYSEGIIDEKKYNDEILKARESMVNGIRSIFSKEGLVLSPETTGYFDILKEESAELESVLSALGREEFFKSYGDELEELGYSTIRLRQKENERERDAMRNSSAYKNATEEQKAGMEELLDEVQKMRDNPFRNWESGLQHVMQFMQPLGDAIGAVFSLVTEAIRRETEEQEEIFQELHDRELERLDAEMHAKLFALGLVEAETVEDYEAQLEAAKRTGDEIAIYEASQALKKANIEQEYADEKARIDEELQQKQLELQYRGEMASWKAQMVQAVVSSAQAQLQAVSSGMQAGYPALMWVIPMLGAMAAVTSAAQIAAINANKPVPHFETGGIVPGSSYSGDNMIIRANSGEAVLTQEQQRNMLDMLNTSSRSGAMANVTLIVQLDAREIGRRTFELAGDGQYFLKARAVH